MFNASIDVSYLRSGSWCRRIGGVISPKVDGAIPCKHFLMLLVDIDPLSRYGNSWVLVMVVDNSLWFYLRSVGLGFRLDHVTHRIRRFACSPRRDFRLWKRGSAGFGFCSLFSLRLPFRPGVSFHISPVRSLTDLVSSSVWSGLIWVRFLSLGKTPCRDIDQFIGLYQSIFMSEICFDVAARYWTFV